MVASWEIKAARKVLCVILHTDVTTMAWSLGFKNLQIPGEHMVLTGMPFDHARNVGAQKVLEMGFEYLFFLDSDVIPPRDAIFRLLAHKKPVISGLYCRRSPPASVPVMIRNGQWITQYQPGTLVEVDLVGAGCLLVHRSVLEQLPPLRPGKNWFDWRVDMQGIFPPGDCLSEDFTFCKQVREQLGLKVLVDTSIVCKHVGYAQSTYGQFQPLETTPVT